MQALHLQQHECRHGTFLINARDTYIGRALIEYGEYSEIEARVLAKILPEGGVAAEVGANLGAFTVPLAKKAGGQGRVYAFEPQPLIFQQLCANCAVNGLGNVEAFNAFCGDSAGEVKIPPIDYSREINYGGFGIDQLPGNATGRPVRIMSLDSLELRRLDLLKIDVEGMELDVLRGAVENIRHRRPVIYLENNRREHSADLIETLFGFEYRLWWHLPPLFNPENWAGRKDNLWPGIVSVNMICVPRERPAQIEGLAEVTDAASQPEML